ncbi:hypothetical protein ACP4OV_001568 [Aristida adscensionis]
MDTEVQLVPAIPTTPGPDNEESEGRNIHAENNGEIVINGVRGSVSEDSMEDFSLLWSLRKYLVLLGILAVGVTYNAGLTPPGGFWAINKDGHKAGDPALRVEFSQRYEVFFYCNATAFAASIVLIILLLSKNVTRQRLWLRSIQLTMTVDLFSLMGAYAAGSCRAPKSSIYIWVLVFAVFIYVWIHILLSTRIFPEVLKDIVQTAVNKVLSIFGSVVEQPSSLLERKDLEEARKFILMLVTFAATVTYQAGLNPPGGFWAENDYLSGSSPSYKYRPATSILRSHYLRRYNIFVCCNSTSFVASLVTIILLLSPHLSVHGIRSKAVVFCVVADLFFLVGAYAAGCCRDVGTSFYVMFIIIIVLLCFALLAWTFVYEPVAKRIAKIKEAIVGWMGVLGRVLSLKSYRTRSINTNQGSTHSSQQQDSVHVQNAPAVDSAVQPEHQSAGNQQVSDTTDGQSCEEHPPADNSEVGNSTEHQAAGCQLDANTKEALSRIEPSSSTNQESPRTMDDTAGSQQVAGMKAHSSTDEMGITDISEEVFPEQNMVPGHHTGATNDLIADEGPSVPVEDSGSVGIEIGGANNNAEHYENGLIHSNRGAPCKNSDANVTGEHLEKTRTYLLLLAILAVSLTYQSGLNPPGGFWSRSENNHSAGDRILEDTNHPRFIAFFYLNAVAFVASIVMIIMLQNKGLSKKVTKHRVLQTTMIVDLLSLTGAFVMGSCRDAKKSTYILVLVCFVLAYVALHVLIVIHVIPPKWKRLVSEKLKHFSCGNFWSALPQLCHRQTGNITSAKELERRRNLLLTIAILAATVTYQAGINPPGGVWSDDRDVSGKPGNPILQDSHRTRYDLFYYSNSVSFVSSVVITILLVNKESCEHGIKSYALRMCLVVGLLGLLIAYAAGSCRNRKESIFLIVIAVAVLVFLVIQALLSSMLNTLAHRMEYLLMLLFGTEEVRREITSESLESSYCAEKIVRKRHKYLMLIATLAASSTYQAGLNPPGGFWSDDNGHVAGNPLLHDINLRRYKTFFCFNAISFMGSIVVIMLLLSKSVRKKDTPLVVLLMIMVLDLLALVTAFAAGSCRKISTSVYVFILVAGVVTYLLILIVLSRGIKKIQRKWKRNGLFCSRYPEHVSRTITPVQEEQV